MLKFYWKKLKKKKNQNIQIWISGENVNRLLFRHPTGSSRCEANDCRWVWTEEFYLETLLMNMCDSANGSTPASLCSIVTASICVFSAAYPYLITHNICNTKTWFKAAPINIFIFTINKFWLFFIFDLHFWLENR